MIRRILEIKEGIWGIFRSPRQITTSEICIVIHTKAEFSNSFSIHSKYFYVLNKLAFSYIFLFNKTLAYFSAWFQNINRCFSLHPCRYSSKSRQSHTLSEYFAYSCISFVQLLEIFSYSKPTLPVQRIDAPTCVLKCDTISKITRMASCTAFSLPCDPNATFTILGTVAVLAASSIEQNASVLVFSQQWRKLTNLTSLVISSIVLYLYLNCK